MRLCLVAWLKLIVARVVSLRSPINADSNEGNRLLRSISEKVLPGSEIEKVHVAIEFEIQSFASGLVLSALIHAAGWKTQQIAEVYGLIAVIVADAKFVGPHVHPPVWPTAPIARSGCVA